MTEEERQALVDNTVSIKKIIEILEAIHETTAKNNDGFIQLHQKEADTMVNLTKSISSLHERLSRLEGRKFLGIF